MIKYVSGDMFKSNADCLVNAVNCVGVMGKGLAYQFKVRFPENNKDYIRACRSKELRIGTIHTFQEDGKVIVNFPTKIHWRNKSEMYYIHDGMRELVKYLFEHPDIKSIAIPPLGCGNGGLDWTTVKPIIVDYLTPLRDNLEILVYEQK